MPAREIPRIAVVGGGIGGLATCAFLHRCGLAATVYEQAPRLTEVGAGLVVAPNAVRRSHNHRGWNVAVGAPAVQTSDHPRAHRRFRT